MSGTTGMYSEACGLFWLTAAGSTLKVSGGSGAPEGAVKTKLITMSSELGRSKNQYAKSLLGWLSAFSWCRLRLTAVILKNRATTSMEERSDPEKKWRLRWSALIRHWTTRLNVITTGGWRFIRLLAAGKAAAAFTRSEVEALSASEFQVSTKNTRYSDYWLWASKGERERERGERGKQIAQSASGEYFCISVSFFMGPWIHRQVLETTAGDQPKVTR